VTVAIRRLVLEPGTLTLNQGCQGCMLLEAGSQPCCGLTLNSDPNPGVLEVATRRQERVFLEISYTSR